MCDYESNGTTVNLIKNKHEQWKKKTDVQQSRQWLWPRNVPGIANIIEFTGFHVLLLCYSQFRLKQNSHIGKDWIFLCNLLLRVSSEHVLNVGE